MVISVKERYKAVRRLRNCVSFMWGGQGGPP